MNSSKELCLCCTPRTISFSLCLHSMFSSIHSLFTTICLKCSFWDHIFPWFYPFFSEVHLMIIRNTGRNYTLRWANHGPSLPASRWFGAHSSGEGPGEGQIPGLKGLVINSFDTNPTFGTPRHELRKIGAPWHPGRAASILLFVTNQSTLLSTNH